MYLRKAVKWTQAARVTARHFVLKHLETHPCIDCGEVDPIVLTFDHVRGDKRHNIATMVSKGSRLTSIQNEIDKCEVRCANCHTRRTAYQFGWFKVLAANARQVEHLHGKQD